MLGDAPQDELHDFDAPCVEFAPAKVNLALHVIGRREDKAVAERDTASHK